MLKSLICALLLCINMCPLHAIISHEQLAQIEEQTCAGPLSPENETFIRSMMVSMNISLPATIRNPSKEIVELSPAHGFHVYNKETHIWYINEAWFNTLTHDERRFVIGNTLYEATDYNKKDATILTTLLGIYAGLEITVAYKIWQQLTSYPTILGYNNSSLKSALFVGTAVLIPFELLVDPVYKACVRTYVFSRIYNRDVHTALQLNCLPAALSYFQKITADMELLMPHDEAYWKPIVQVLKKRIENMEKAVQQHTLSA